MKFEIKTVFENVDDEWLEWYFNRLANEEVVPGSTKVIQTLRNNDFAFFSSKDPTSNVTATTYYSVERLPTKAQKE